MEKNQIIKTKVILGFLMASALLVGIFPLQARAAVTVTITDQATGLSSDVTTNWIPTPGIPVRLSGATSFVLIRPDATSNYPNATTNYPGRCSNGPACNAQSDDPLDADFTLVNNADGTATLTPYDYGGIAVVMVEGAPTKFPADSDNDGLADSREIQYYGNLTTVNSNSDTDFNPATNTNSGDGLTALDEYRGFIANGSHIRTSPNEMDFFVILAKAPTSLFPADPLEFASRIGFIIHEILQSEAGIDKSINSNRPSGTLQRALKVTESLDPNVIIVGDAIWGTPNSVSAYAFIYTQKIVNLVNGWYSSAYGASMTVAQQTQRDLDKVKYIKSVIAQEIGHNILRIGTYSNTNGYHYKQNQGTIMEKTFSFNSNNPASSLNSAIPSNFSLEDKQFADLN